MKKILFFLAFLFSFFSCVSFVDAGSQEGRMVATYDGVAYIGSDGYLYKNGSGTSVNLGLSGSVSSNLDGKICYVNSSGSGACEGFSLSIPNPGLTSIQGWIDPFYGYYTMSYVKNGVMYCIYSPGYSNIGTSYYPCSSAFSILPGARSYSWSGAGCAIDSNNDLQCKGQSGGNNPYSVTGDFVKVTALANKSNPSNVYYAGIY